MNLEITVLVAVLAGVFALIGVSITAGVSLWTKHLEGKQKMRLVRLQRLEESAKSISTQRLRIHSFRNTKHPKEKLAEAMAESAMSPCVRLVVASKFNYEARRQQWKNVIQKHLLSRR